MAFDWAAMVGTITRMVGVVMLAAVSGGAPLVLVLMSFGVTLPPPTVKLVDCLEMLLTPLSKHDLDHWHDITYKNLAVCGLLK